MKPTRMNAMTCEAIHAIKSDIDQRPFDKKSIMGIISDTGICRNLLQKGFKHFMGSGIKEYQKRKRLEAASVLIEEDRYTIQQIAAKCGYHSQSSFTRAFKEIFGVTPTEWKSRNDIELSVTDNGGAFMYKNSAVLYNNGAKGYN